MKKSEGDCMNKKGYVVIEFLIVLFILASIAASLIQPYIEMKTFNKHSETKATYLEAMFSNLRITSK